MEFERITEKLRKRIALSGKINGHVLPSDSYDGQYTLGQIQREESVNPRLWQSSTFSFSGMDKYAGDEENRPQSHKSYSQHQRQFLKEITGKTYGQNSFPHVSYILSNKFSARLIDKFHRNKLYYVISILSSRFYLRGVLAPSRKARRRVGSLNENP